MPGELINEFAPATRVLVLVLDACRSERIAHGGWRRADLLKSARGGLGLCGELRLLVGRGTVAATGHHKRASAVRIGKAEMQRSKTTHGQAHDMRLVDAESIHDRPDVVTCPLLRVS